MSTFAKKVTSAVLTSAVVFSTVAAGANGVSAAFTNVDLCEKERERAYSDNILVSLYLKNAAEYMDIPLIYFSTDYVFDGNNCSSFTSRPAPQAMRTIPIVRGATKLPIWS